MDSEVSPLPRWRHCPPDGVQIASAEVWSSMLARLPRVGESLATPTQVAPARLMEFHEFHESEVSGSILRCPPWCSGASRPHIVLSWAQWRREGGCWPRRAGLVRVQAPLQNGCSRGWWGSQNHEIQCFHMDFHVSWGCPQRQ